MPFGASSPTGIAIPCGGEKLDPACHLPLLGSTNRLRHPTNSSDAAALTAWPPRAASRSNAQSGKHGPQRIQHAVSGASAPSALTDERRRFGRRRELCQLCAALRSFEMASTPTAKSTRLPTTIPWLIRSSIISE